MTRPLATVLPGGHSEWEPPDPFSNSEVNTLCADASVDFVDVKVGHCQALNSMQTGKPPTGNRRGFFFLEQAAFWVCLGGSSGLEGPHHAVSRGDDRTGGLLR